MCFPPSSGTQINRCVLEEFNAKDFAWFSTKKKGIAWQCHKAIVRWAHHLQQHVFAIFSLVHRDFDDW